MKKKFCLFLAAALIIICVQAIAEREPFDEIGEFRFMLPTNMELSEEDSSEEVKMYFAADENSVITMAAATVFEIPEISESVTSESEWRNFAEIYIDKFIEGKVLTATATETVNNGEMLKAETTMKLEDDVNVQICFARGKNSILILMYANENYIDEALREWMFSNVSLK